MKKLMTAAAAVALAAATQAGIVVNTNCNPRSTSCPVVAFKVTANGKIAAPATAEYVKTTTKLSVKKGALVIFPTQSPYSTDPNDCCYDAYSLYLTVQVGKTKVPVGVFYEALDSWSIYGKNYNKSLDAEKSKKFSVESEIGLGYSSSNSGGRALGQGNDAQGIDTITGTAGTSEDLALDDFAFIATAFGKGTYAYNYKEGKGCNACTVLADYYEFTPGSYSGWFAGLVTDLGGDFGCLLCDCANLDVFGGTWKAKYDKTWSKTAEGWQKAASYGFSDFGSSMLADMIGDPTDPTDDIE